MPSTPTFIRTKMRKASIKIGIILVNLIQSSSFAPPGVGFSAKIGYAQLTKLNSSRESYSVTSTAMNSTVDSSYEDETRTQLRVPSVKPKMPTHEGAKTVTPIHSISDFLREVENTETNALVVVKFHAKWCKVCARVILKFKKMADQLLKTKTPVPIKFVSVEVTENPQLCSTLGVVKFPFIQIYRNKECVAAFGTGPAHNFQKVVGDTLDHKLHSTEDEWKSFRADFKDAISENLEKLKMLKLESAIQSGISNLSP